MISKKNIKIVSIDLPNSHKLLDASDEFTQRMLSAFNSMMLDMFVAITRKNFTDRRRRQAQGVQKLNYKKNIKGDLRMLNYNSKLKVF